MVKILEAIGLSSKAQPEADSPTHVHDDDHRDDDRASDDPGSNSELHRKFRTITLMIHLLNPVVEATEHSDKLTSQDTRSLRILTALAIAIADHREVTAVVSSRHQSRAIPQDEGTAATTTGSTANRLGVQVIASGQSNDAQAGILRAMSRPPEPPEPPDESLTAKISELFKLGYRTLFYLLRNPQDTLPHVRLCEMVQLDFALDISASLENILPLDTGKQPFERHTAILTAYLNALTKEFAQSPQGSDDADTIQNHMSWYIMARSAPRMQERMNNKYSKDIFNALRRVNIMEISEMKFLPASATPLRKSQLKRDRKFLEAIRSNIMRQYLESIGVAVPTLFATSLDRTTSFYEKPTAIEIHKFLVETLADFRTSVAKLAKKQYRGGVTPKPGAECGDERKDLIIRVECASHLLCLFIYSSAAFAHFDGIRGYLVIKEREIDLERKLKELEKKGEPAASAALTQSPAASTQPASESAVELDPVVDDVDEELECGLGDDDGEDDFTTLTNHADNEAKWDPTTKKYMRSIRRQISHTEAINILCAMCRKLATTVQPQDPQPVISITALTVSYPGNVIMPWKKVVDEIWPKTADTIWSAQEVKNRLSTLEKFSDAKFCFGGTLHCEACLASLLDMGTLKSLKIEQGIIGVSKRCCPACTKLIELLANRRGQLMRIAGSHHTIYPCSLPYWLPKCVIREMIKHFEDILLDKLCNFMKQDGSRGSLSGDSVGFDPSSSGEDGSSSADESRNESAKASNPSLFRLKEVFFAKRQVRSAVRSNQSNT